MAKKTGLGKGLDALFSDDQLEAEAEYIMCPIEIIRPNRYQPRKNLNTEDDSFKELVSSIKQKGIIQPLLVTPLDDGYELIAGERRLRAAKAAGLKEVPVIIKKQVSETERLEMALIENLQRQDLSVIEEAEAYYRLMKEFGLTQEEVASRVGKDRATVANILRLRKLPSVIKEDLINGRLSMGHARALLNLPLERQLDLRNEILNKGLSVREVERRVKQLKSHPKNQKSSKREELVVMEEVLTEALERPVRIVAKKRGGMIQIPFTSKEELEAIVQKIAGA